MHPATTHHPEPPPPTGPSPEDTAFFRATLNELIAMGTDIARRLHRDLTDQPTPDAPAPENPEARALAFERVARAVRRTILLAQRLETAAPQRAAPAPSRDPAQHRIQARTHLIRKVEAAIGAQAQDAVHAETLNAEFRDRLDAPDLEDDIYARPVQDIIDDILQDLGVHLYSDLALWPRRTAQDLRRIADLARSPPHTPPDSRRIDPASLPDPFPKTPRRCEGERKAIAKILLWDHQNRA